MRGAQVNDFFAIIRKYFIIFIFYEAHEAEGVTR